MKIGELARACKTSIRMIRFYEKLNLVSPQRNSSGYRIYKAQDIDFIKKVMILNRAGLPLKDIALLRDCLNDEPQDFCTVLRRKLEDKRADIDRQIDSLNESKALLDNLLAR